MTHNLFKTTQLLINVFFLLMKSRLKKQLVVYIEIHFQPFDPRNEILRPVLV